MAFGQMKNTAVHDSKEFMKMLSVIKKDKQEAPNKIIEYITERILVQVDMSSVISNYLVSNRCNLHTTCFWSLYLSLDK